METPFPILEDVETQDLLAAHEDSAPPLLPEEDASNDDGESPSTLLPPASYWNLIVTHKKYRLFIASYIITHCGEWFNYVASMTVLESVSHSQSRLLRISILICVRLLPNVLVAPLGGVLADTHDLRISMIGFDILGAAVALSFIMAQYLERPELIYLSTFLQQSCAGLYEPCRSAIVPQLVREGPYLQKATTLSGIAWSTMAAVGSSLGGLLVASLGVSTCFVLDSLTYLLSAWLLWLMHGSFNEAALANKNDDENSSSHLHSSWWDRIVGMTWEGIHYMQASPYGALVWIKFSGALMFGASDVMLAAFASSSSSGELQSQKLGYLFASVGVGAMMGPLLSDPCIDMNRLITVQRLCVFSFAVICIGYIGIGASSSFVVLCVFTMIRASGMAVAWIDSTLLIQKLMPAAILGRIFAADVALGTGGECISALYAGLLLDYVPNFTPNQLAFLQAIISALLFILWSVYHYQGGGVQQESK
jgi:hypothetical protein